MKILTVIVPSYNMEEYLPKALGSLVVDDADLLGKLEVIVVNDGSTDRTSQIAHGFETRHPGVFRVVDKENGHYGSCINAALPVATGFYVKVLDADDWFLTDNFRDFLAFLDAECAKGTDAADLALCGFEVENNCLTSFGYSYLKKKPGATIADIDFNRYRPFEMFAVAYRTDNIRSIGYRQREGITHTDKQWLNLPMTTVRKIAVFDKPVYHYLEWRPGNTCNRTAYYETFGKSVEILKTMAAEYGKVSGTLRPENDAYCRNHLFYRARRAYQVYLLIRHPALSYADLAGLDDSLRDNAKWLYDMTDAMTLSRKVRYHYVRAWRKKQRLTFALKAEIGVLMVFLRMRLAVLRLFGRA